MGKNYKIFNVIFLLIIFCGVSFLYIVKSEIVNAPQCYYKARYGIECPTCGLTRDLIHLSNGNLNVTLINRNSLLVFTFFVYLVISRLFSILCLFLYDCKKVLVADIFISLIPVLFLIIRLRF